MKTSIKLLLSAAVLAASSTAAFGSAFYSGNFSDVTQTFTRPGGFQSADGCGSSGYTVPYMSYTVVHDGGQLNIKLNSNDFDTFLGLYDGAFDATNPCDNAIEYDDDGGQGGFEGVRNSAISRDLPAGEYTVVATSYFVGEDGEDGEIYGYGTYTLTIGNPPLATTPVPVPVAGIPALALGSIALIGAAGFMSRRRKAKVEQN